MKAFGSVIGIVADFGGAGSAIGGLVSLFLQGHNDRKTALDGIDQYFRDNLQRWKQQNARARGDAIAERMDRINDALADGESVLTTLKADLNANLSYEGRSE